MEKKLRVKKFNVLALLLLILGTVSPSISVFAETQLFENMLEVTEQEVTNKKNESTSTLKSEEYSVNKEPEIATGNVQTENKKSEVTDSPKIVEHSGKYTMEHDQSKETKKLTILGTSDVHGNIWDWSYEDNKAADLGFAKIGTVVKTERAKNPNTILVDAGDNLQGTLAPILEIRTSCLL